MPTNYNFRNDELFGRLFPNRSNGDAFRIYGDRSSFTGFATYTLSTEKSPFGTPACRVVDTGGFGSIVYLSTGNSITSNPPFSPNSNVITKCTTPRTYTFSFHIKGIIYPVGATVRCRMDWENSEGNGFQTVTGSGDILLDGSWQYVNFTETVLSSSQVLTRPYEYGSIVILLLNMSGVASEVLIADLKVTDSTLTTTTSFDNQFIPADTFRQGNLWTWGYNYKGALGITNFIGDSTTAGYQTTPVRVNSYSGWKTLGTGSGGPQRFAIDTNGYLWFWGGYASTNSWPLTSNVGTRNIYSTPTFSASSGTWVEVTRSGGSGNYTGHGIKTDGTLWSWGLNDSGLLGINTNINSQTLVQEITSSSNWKQVSGGISHVAAIKTDGTLWSWGSNASGRLGTNDTIARSTPVQEWTSSTNWKQVSCMYRGTVAIKTDGTMWFWGSTEFSIDQTRYVGGGSECRSTPSREGGLRTDWKTVDCTPYFAYSGGVALTNSGNAYRFGAIPANNGGSNTAISVEQFATTANKVWKKCLAGNTTYLIATDGTLWGYGQNGESQLGTLDNIFRSTVVQITTLSNWKQITYGAFAQKNFHAIQYIDPII